MPAALRQRARMGMPRMGKNSPTGTSDRASKAKALDHGLAMVPPGGYSADELAALERRERLSGWLVLFFAGAAIGTAALAFFMFSQDVEPNDQFVRADRDQSPERPEQSFVWGEGNAPSDPDRKDTAAPEAKPEVAATMPPVPPPPAAAPTRAAPPAKAPAPLSSPSTASFAGPPPGSVDRETARALRKGEAQLWREKGERGYVLVSDAVTYGTRECRQVSYTRFENGDQATSPVAQWCRTNGTNRWRPDPRGPE